MSVLRPSLRAPLLIATVATVLFTAPTAEAREPFEQGSVQISAGLSTAVAFNQRYVALGGGAGYYVLDGLRLGLSGDFWFGAKPLIGSIMPDLTYVVFPIPIVKPYVGVLYRHYFIGDGFDDVNALGARAGLYYVSGGGTFIGGGARYEHTLACSRDCGLWWPEIMISLSF